MLRETNKLLSLLIGLPEHTSLVFTRESKLHLAIEVRRELVDDRITAIKRFISTRELERMQPFMLIEYITQAMNDFNTAFERDQNGLGKQTEDGRG